MLFGVRCNNAEQDNFLNGIAYAGTDLMQVLGYILQVWRYIHIKELFYVEFHLFIFIFILFIYTLAQYICYNVAFEQLFRTYNICIFALHYFHSKRFRTKLLLIIVIFMFALKACNMRFRNFKSGDFGRRTIQFSGTTVTCCITNCWNLVILIATYNK